MLTASLLLCGGIKMKYYVYADVERTSYDKGSFFMEFDTKDEALACCNEIKYITDNYDHFDELQDAIVNNEYAPIVIGTWQSYDDRTPENNASEWIYNTYSDLIMPNEEYIRSTINEIRIIEGNLIEVK